MSKPIPPTKTSEFVLQKTDKGYQAIKAEWHHHILKYFPKSSGIYGANNINLVANKVINKGYNLEQLQNLDIEITKALDSPKNQQILSTVKNILEPAIKKLKDEGGQELFSFIKNFMCVEGKGATNQNIQAFDKIIKSFQNQIGIANHIFTTPQGRDKLNTLIKQLDTYKNYPGLNDKTLELLAIMKPMIKDKRISLNSVDALVNIYKHHLKERLQTAIEKKDFSKVTPTDSFDQDLTTVILLENPDIYQQVLSIDSQVSEKFIQPQILKKIHELVGTDISKVTPQDYGNLILLVNDLKTHSNDEYTKKFTSTLINQCKATLNQWSSQRELTAEQYQALSWIKNPKDIKTQALKQLSPNELRCIQEYSLDPFKRVELEAKNIIKQQLKTLGVPEDGTVKIVSNGTLNEITYRDQKESILNPLQNLINAPREQNKNFVQQFQNDIVRNQLFTVKDGHREVSNTSQKFSASTKTADEYTQDYVKDLEKLVGAADPKWVKLIQALSTQTTSIGPFALSMSLQGAQANGSISLPLDTSQITFQDPPHLHSKIEIIRDTEGAISAVKLKIDSKYHAKENPSGDNNYAKTFDWGIELGYEATFTLKDNSILEVKEYSTSYKSFGFGKTPLETIHEDILLELFGDEPFSPSNLKAIIEKNPELAEAVFLQNPEWIEELKGKCSDPLSQDDRDLLTSMSQHFRWLPESQDEWTTSDGLATIDQLKLPESSFTYVNLELDAWKRALSNPTLPRKWLSQQFLSKAISFLNDRSLPIKERHEKIHDLYSLLHQSDELSALVAKDTAQLKKLQESIEDTNQIHEITTLLDNFDIEKNDTTSLTAIIKKVSQSPERIKLLFKTNMKEAFESLTPSKFSTFTEVDSFLALATTLKTIYPDLEIGYEIPFHATPGQKLPEHQAILNRIALVNGSLSPDMHTKCELSIFNAMNTFWNKDTKQENVTRKLELIYDYNKAIPFDFHWNKASEKLRSQICATLNTFVEKFPSSTRQTQIKPTQTTSDPPQLSATSLELTDKDQIQRMNLINKWKFQFNDMKLVERTFGRTNISEIAVGNKKIDFSNKLPNNGTDQGLERVAYLAEELYLYLISQKIDATTAQKMVVKILESSRADDIELFNRIGEGKALLYKISPTIETINFNPTEKTNKKFSFENGAPTFSFDVDLELTSSKGVHGKQFLRQPGTLQFINTKDGVTQKWIPKKP